MKGCTAPACARTALARGLCGGHYARARRGKPIDEPVRATSRAGVCSASGCSDPINAKRLCRRHYRRLRATGTLEGPPFRRRKGTGSIDKATGYKVITVAGVRWLEHRYVMSQALGRPLRPEEEVHHRNGRRADNRLANLEVWVTSQPAGQRPEDLVAYVVRYYPDLVREALR